MSVSLLIVAIAAPDFWTALTVDPGQHRGTDYLLYMAATKSWLAGSGFYPPSQLAGPYVITPGDILYPPVALWLFVPFTVLPAMLWWLIPLAAGAAAVARHRPTVLVWPLIALVLAWQPVEIRLLSGNPVIWSFAALAVGTHIGGWAVGVLLKPTFAPFAIWGIRRKWWWGSLLLFALASLALLPMWTDWARVLLNSRNPAGILYAWQETPLLLLPVIAWWGSTTRPRRPQPAAAGISRGLTARAPSS